MTKQKYILTSGQHIDAEGKRYKKGDAIELTEKAAKGLANKIAKPGDLVSVSSDERIIKLEKENADLRAQLEELKSMESDKPENNTPTTPPKKKQS